MRRALPVSLAFLALCQVVLGDTICLWDFNSPIPDGSTTTGSISPTAGTGYATLIGGTTGAYVSGGTPDPESGDDSAWSISKYPSTLYSNRTAGVRFMVSTVGFEGIRISWAEQHSSAASRYMRPQYTVDGLNFIDLPPLIITRDGSYTNVTFDLGSVTGTTNNPLFGFQILAEFESSAAGGLPGYIGTAGEYGSAGTVKFDMVRVTGQTIGDSNTPPYIFSDITDQVLAANGVSGSLGFTVLDAEEPATGLRVEGSSSNPVVLPVENISLGGSGANRTVTMRAAGIAGESRIGLRVVDSGGKSALLSFNVTVLPANSPPVISGLSFTHSLAGKVAGPLIFRVDDAECLASALVVQASANDTWLLPPGAMDLSGSGTNRSLLITPAPGRYGVTPVTISVSDGENVSFGSFPFMVLPSAGLVFYEGFNYMDGGVTTNSAQLWQHRSGAQADCLVTNGMLRLGKLEGEDVGAQLIGAPYGSGTGVVLYAGMRLRVPVLPGDKPDYFAHFVMGSSQVGRIAIGTTNAIEGTYRLFVGNGVEAVYPSFPMSMDLKVVYRVVMSYAVDTGRTTLWVNPASEGSPSVTALDVVENLGKVTAFAFRQSSGLGPELFIDDLRIGLSFEAVSGGGSERPWLRYEWDGGALRLSWDDAADVLQGSGAADGIYTNIPGARSPFSAGVLGARGFFRLRGE